MKKLLTFLTGKENEIDSLANWRNTEGGVMKNNYCQDCIVHLCPGFVDDDERIECHSKKTEKQSSKNVYCPECGYYHFWEVE